MQKTQPFYRTLFGNEKSILLLLICFNFFLYPILDPDKGFLLKYNKIRDYSYKKVDQKRELDHDMTFVYASSNCGDIENYIKLARSEESRAPFIYRKLYPKTVGWMSNFWFGSKDKLPIIYTTIYMNLILCCMILFLAYKIFKPLSYYPLLLAIFIISSPGIYKTFPYLMIEIPAVLCMLLLIQFRKNIYLQLICIALAMSVKEVFVLWSIPLFMNYLKEKKLTHLLLCAVPPAFFVMNRLLLKDDLLSVNFGWKLSQGEIKFNFLMNKFKDLKSIVFSLLRIALLLSPLILLFLSKYRKGFKNYLVTNSPYLLFVAILLISSFVFANRIIRPLVIITPLLLYTVYQYRHSIETKESSSC